MDNTSPPPQPPVVTIDFAKEEEARTWAMFMHLSLYAGKLIPIAGWIVTIIMWQMKKDTLPKIDEHGKAILNWVISLTIYCAVAGALTTVCIGFFLFIPLLIMALIFPAIGAIKAKDGIVWKYPLSIPIL